MESRRATHPTAEVLQAFGLGKLNDSSTAALMAHLDLCADCRKTVASISGDDFLDRLRQAHSRSSTSAPVQTLGGNEGKPKPPPGPTTLFNLPPELAGNPQYDILRELGRGGMGVVYLAKNKLMDRLEVLKVINKTLLDRPGAVERFLREIRSAAKLNHVNVVAAYSALQLGDLLVFAMEYVEGQDLAAVVKAQGPLPVPHACFYVQQAAQGLQHAFEKKMVHRDIKPQNLILAREGRKHLVKVLDFGLAKMMRENPDDTGLTGEGKMLGTPDYMAPEQTLDATSADIRADIYSLGCTLYFLLSGSRPFKCKNLYEIMQAHQSLEAPALNLARPEVPEELAAVVRKMMAKDRGQRYQTPLEVVQALGPFVKQRATTKSLPELSVRIAKTAGVPTVSVEGPPPPAVAAQSPPPVAWDSLTESVIAAARPHKRGAAAEPVSRMRWLLGSGVAACLLLLGLLSYWLATVLFRVETANGTLVVEMNDDEVEARIQKGKLILTDPDGKVRYTLSPNERSNKLEVGAYKIRVEGADGLVLDTSEFTIKKGGKVKVRVSLEPKAIPQVAAAVAADALRRADIPAATLRYVGGGDPARAPAELVAVLGDTRFRVGGKSFFPAFSPDGTRIAAQSENEVFLFDADSGQLRQRFQGRTGEKISFLAFSPDGTLLAMGERTNVRVADLRTGALLHDLPGHTDWVACIAFTSNGRTLVSCAIDRSVRVYDVKTGRQTQVFSCKEWVWSVAVMPDGRRVAAALMDGSVHGWSIESGEEQFVVSGSEAGRASVSVSNDGQWLACGTNHKVKVWKIAELTKKDATPFFEKATPANWVQFEAHSHNLWTGEHASRDADCACCWDPATGKLVSSVPIRIKDFPGAAYALSPDDRTLAVCNFELDRIVRLYDTRTGKPRLPDPGHSQGVYSVAFSPDGRWLASAGIETAVRVWDLTTGKQRHLLRSHTQPVFPVTFSPDGKLLASGSHDGTIALWDPVTGVLVRILRGHEPNASVWFSSDGRFVAEGTREGGVRMWYARNGEEARILRGLHDGPVRTLAFSSDGTRLATGGEDGKLVITDLASEKILHSFKRNTGLIAVDFGADGETVATGYAPPESVVRIWNLKDKDFVGFTGHTDRVNMVRLRPDGRLAISTAEDGVVRLWEVGGNPGRKMVLATGLIGEKLRAGALSADGRYVATGNSNGTIYLFRLPASTENIGEWLAARSTLPRGLSEEVWNKRVNSLYVANVPDAVVERLRELNPGFDHQIWTEMEDGQVAQLRLGIPNVKNISPLRALTGLRRLFMWEGPLSDLSPLKDLPLTMLEISRTRVSDLTPLKHMKLTWLHCALTPVSDLTPLKNMKLTYLNCQHTQVSDLSSLKDAKLTVLDCRLTRVSDLTPLRGMPLTELYFSLTGVSDLSPLADMKLTTLYCDHTQVTGAGLAPLQEMSSLRWLEVGGPKTTDAGLEYLKKLTNLEVLCLYTHGDYSKGPLTGAGLVHLKGMTKLRILRLDNTELTDEGLAHLKSLVSLRDLTLNQTRLTDAGLEHLAGLKNLAALRLGGTAVTDKGVAKLKAALPKCNINR